MEEVVVQISNNRAFSLLENLEALNVIKVLSRTPYDRSERTARLSEIRSITENIHVDLSNFRFNRDEANNYDE